MEFCTAFVKEKQPTQSLCFLKRLQGRIFTINPKDGKGYVHDDIRCVIMYESTRDKHEKSHNTGWFIALMDNHEGDKVIIIRAVKTARDASWTRRLSTQTICVVLWLGSSAMLEGTSPSGNSWFVIGNCQCTQYFVCMRVCYCYGVYA